jgi:hypothetical protein
MRPMVMGSFCNGCWIAASRAERPALVSLTRICVCDVEMYTLVEMGWGECVPFDAVWNRDNAVVSRVGIEA